jgi:hypothetical protein
MIARALLGLTATVAAAITAAALIVGLGKWFAIIGAGVCLLVLAVDLGAYLLRERRRRGREAVWARRERPHYTLADVHDIREWRER